MAMDWSTSTKAVYTTGTVIQAGPSASDWTIRIRPEDNIKSMLIYTDGALQFSGVIFEPNSDYFTHRDTSGSSAVQDYTEVAGAVPLELTPMVLLHGANVTFTVTNPTLAPRKWQIWLLR